MTDAQARATLATTAAAALTIIGLLLAPHPVGVAFIAAGLATYLVIAIALHD
jgi:hypothetical protein